MIIIGIILVFVGLAYLCWLLFDLAVYALPFSALCGRPHKADYVACHDMWRTAKSTLILREPPTRAPHICEAKAHAGKP